MFDLFKKEKLVLQHIKTNINDIKNILDEVHASLFSVDTLEEERLKELEEKIKKAYEKRENCPSLEINKNVGSHLLRSLLYEFFWVELVFFLALTLGVTNFSIPIFLVIGVYKGLKDRRNEKISLIVEKEEKILEDLYKEVGGRIKYYKNIIAIKEAKLKVIDDPEEKDSPLILANRYLEMLLDNEITLLDIPIDIQKVMLVMLQNELGITGSLIELIEVLKEKNKEKRAIKVRKVRINY